MKSHTSPPRDDGVASSVVQQAFLGDVSVDGRIVKTIVGVVLFLQFVVPVIPTILHHMLFTHDTETEHSSGKVQCAADSQESMVARDPLCDCEASTPWQKMLQPDFLGTYPFQSQFRFYDVQNATCVSRAQQPYVEYAMKDSCLAEVLIRDEDSCRDAANRMLPQGSHFVWKCWEESPGKRACSSMPEDNVQPPPLVGQACNITNQRGRLEDFIQNSNLDKFENFSAGWTVDEAGSKRMHLRFADTWWLDQHANVTRRWANRESWTLSYADTGRVMLQSSAGKFLHEADGKLHVSGETGLYAEWDVTPMGHSKLFLTSYRDQRLSAGGGDKPSVSLARGLSELETWQLFDAGQGNVRLRSQGRSKWLQERDGILVLSDAVGGFWRMEAAGDENHQVLLKSSGGLYLHDDAGDVVLDAKAGPTAKWALTHAWRSPTVIHFSPQQPCSIWTRGNEEKYVDTQLKYCFALDPVHTQISTLCLALLVAIGLSSLGHTAHEAEDPSVAVKVRRGALRMATQHKVGTVKAIAALAIRFFQTMSSVGCILLLLFSLRPALALLIVLLATLPLFWMYGGSVFKQPTLLVSPPDFSLFFPQARSQAAKFHLTYLVLLQVATLAVFGYNGAVVLQTGEAHTVGSFADNVLAMLSFAKQGALAVRIVSGWSIAFAVSLLLHVNFVAMVSLFKIHPFEQSSSTAILLLLFSPLVNLFGTALMLICVVMFVVSLGVYRPFAEALADPAVSQEQVELQSTIMSLAKDLQGAAATRFNDREGTLLRTSDHAEMLEVGLWESRCTVDFPEGVQPVRFVAWTSWRVPLPAKLTSDLSLLFADIVTDTMAWSSFLRQGHVLFAGFLALASWTSTLIQLREGLLERAIVYARESHMAGIPTVGWIHLLDTEKGLEALVALIVQGYGNFFAGLTFPFDAASNSLSIFLSMVGISTYLRDNFDYEGVQQVTTTEKGDDLPHAVRVFYDPVRCFEMTGCFVLMVAQFYAFCHVASSSGVEEPDSDVAAAATLLQKVGRLHINS
eukprot:TRINITY_DN11812_c0_g1_i1.p1 TRINITY_DN11812_c0_g1~~TRINITY_DN11812_c0_g1_i1.p1  ORF type:complete len:1021 (-),score=124.16 TRINITY_DN11812_c0_g1_i1:161-3223(-)